ncbi:MAG TPA: hypothetical protein IAC12_03655 [Candidatus Aphodovivens avistercoris]|nr:hypothetical protein [Candidatus Aphodovivens avistercoris]
MGLIPKMPIGEPETSDAICGVPHDVADEIGVPELDVFQMGYLAYSVEDAERGGDGYLLNDLENPYDLERFDRLRELGLVCDDMERMSLDGENFFQVRYKTSLVGLAVVRKVAAWNRLERDKREWKRLHPFIGDPKRVASANRLGRDLAMLAVGAVLSQGLQLAAAMLL